MLYYYDKKIIKTGFVYQLHDFNVRIYVYIM